MKKIEAIVKPAKVDAIQKGLREVGLPSMTVFPVKGCGRQKSYSPVYNSSKKNKALQPKMMIICVVNDSDLEKCVDVILDNASEGHVGDGKIFIYEVVEAIRIRTRKRGKEALI